MGREILEKISERNDLINNNAFECDIGLKLGLHVLIFI